MKSLSPKYQIWIDARKRFHLSHAHIQMTRELGMNPRKFGKLANHQQEPWKAPLPDFIAALYRKRFGKDRPDVVRPLEKIVAEKKKKMAEKKARKKAGSGKSLAAGLAPDAIQILHAPDKDFSPAGDR